MWLELIRGGSGERLECGIDFRRLRLKVFIYRGIIVKDCVLSF